MLRVHIHSEKGNNMKKQAVLYFEKLGKVLLEEEDGAITTISVTGMIPDGTDTKPDSPLLLEAARQLEEYLNGERKTFSLPLAPKGTDFQRRVWKALQDIPYGETRTYKQIAEAVGNAKGCRAVGMANNKNPIIIMIPCHRVIGSDGSLTGYAAGLELKQELLSMESTNGNEKKCLGGMAPLGKPVRSSRAARP